MTIFSPPPVIQDVNLPLNGALDNGCHTLTASSTAEEITATGNPCQGMLVKAASSNVATVYVGISDVTDDWDEDTGGWPLEPGESVAVPCQISNEVYVIGEMDDKVAWIINVQP
jgi:hypothetical protein